MTAAQPAGLLLWRGELSALKDVFRISKECGTVELADYYRKQAEDCLKQAERTSDLVQGEAWLKLAEAWSEIAQYVERKDEN